MTINQTSNSVLKRSLLFIVCSLCLALGSTAQDRASQDGKNTKAQFRSNYFKAMQAMSEYRLDSTKYFIDQCLKISLENENDTLLGFTYMGLGQLFDVTGELDLALEYELKALRIYQELSLINSEVFVYNNLSWSHIQFFDYQNGVKYALKGISLLEQVEDSISRKATAGYLYNNLAIAYLEIDEPDSSFLANSKAEFHSSTLKGQPELKAYILAQFASIHQYKLEYEKSIDYFERCLLHCDSTNAWAAQTFALSHYCKLLNDIESYDESIKYATAGLNIAHKAGNKRYMIDILDELRRAYESLNNVDSAYFYARESTRYEDSVFNQQKNLDIQSLKYGQQISKREKEHELALKEEEKTRNMSFAFGGLILLLAMGLYSRLNYVRKSRETIKMEKARSDNLLLNILPAEIAQELKEKGKADARDFDMVSILFTDFKEFTQASEKLTAQELVSEINSCFEAFDAIMEKYKIEKIKTIGDAYMAAGGLPVPTENSTKNTVLAALEMQDFIVKRLKERAMKELPAFKMRVGIHTGPVVAGIVGVKKFQYDIWGDTVNTASRMESNSEAGKVNVSQSTYNLIKGEAQFNFERRGKVEVKGKGEMDMYFVSHS